MTARKLVSVSAMGLAALALMAFQEEPVAPAADQGVPWLVWVLLALVALGLIWLAWQRRDVDAFADAHHDDHGHDGHDHDDHSGHDHAPVSVEDENARDIPLTPVDDTVVVAPPMGAPEDIALASAMEAIVADADSDRDAEPVGGDAAPAIVDTTPPVATPMSNADTEPLPPPAAIPATPVADVDTPRTTASIGQNTPTASSSTLQGAAGKVQDEIAEKGNSVSLGQNTRRDTMEFRVGEDTPGELVQRPHNVADTFTPTPMTNVAEERGDVPEVVGNSEPGVPDDLQIIEGIGPKIAGVLIENGVRTFGDLAATDIGILEAILHNAGLSSITNPGTWSAQAALAADEKWDELEAMQKELKGGRAVE